MNAVYWSVVVYSIPIFFFIASLFYNLKNPGIFMSERAVNEFKTSVGTQWAFTLFILFWPITLIAIVIAMKKGANFDD